MKLSLSALIIAEDPNHEAWEASSGRTASETSDSLVEIEPATERCPVSPIVVRDPIRVLVRLEGFAS